MPIDEAIREAVREELQEQLAPIRERLERPRGALRPDEAADYLGFSETTIRDLVRRGELGGIRSPALRIPIVELDRWIAENTHRVRGVA